MHELWRLPNLLSLSRIAMTPLIGYFLSLNSPTGTLLCVLLLIVAGITDLLDGILARRMGLISDTGKALDPIADKIMAGVLIALLILYREFPLWLAAIILGRDLLILLAGWLLLRGRRIVIGSNTTGKYTFAAIAVLLGSYVVRFAFGIALMTPITIALIALSLYFYTRVFLHARRGETPPQPMDRPVCRMLRVSAMIALIVILVYKLAEQYL